MSGVMVFAETGAEPIADSILASQFGLPIDRVNVRSLVLEGIELGYRKGKLVEAAKTCLCPEWLPREEWPHVYDDCPFYCESCNYDTHLCHFCGDHLGHDMAGHCEPEQ